jgi:hypothetical protein
MLTTRNPQTLPVSICEFNEFSHYAERIRKSHLTKQKSPGRSNLGTLPNAPRNHESIYVSNADKQNLTRGIQ